MPWQYHVATGLLAHDENGDLLHRQGLLSVARQNGKSFLLSGIVGFWATVMPKLRGKPQTIITMPEPTTKNLIVDTPLFRQQQALS